MNFLKTEKDLEELVVKLKKIEEKAKNGANIDKKIKIIAETIKNYENLCELEKEYWDLLTQSKTSEEDNILIKEEIFKINEKKKKELIELSEQILEREESEKNILVEIRPGTGGTEAGLFARDIFRMYYKFSEKKSLKVETIETKIDSFGNFTFVSFLVKGKKAFYWFKNESGVHRVQRVPATENKGRIHTSTATVVVLPEAKNNALMLKQQDIKIDTYRSSGAGGQHVNTTDSAVRITHIPTGVVATSQDGRSQHDNKEKAMFILRSRILEKKLEEEANKVGKVRSSIIKNSERAEKIRTYNFPQDRLTEHRLGLSWNNLNSILEGNCEEIFLLLKKKELFDNLEKLS